MALIGKIAIAMAVDTRKLGAGLKAAQGMVGSFQAKIEQSGSALKALLAGAAAYKAAQGLKSMVTTASDLNENMSKTQAIFGAGAKTVVAAADEMAAAFGTSKNEFLDAAGRMGGLFKGAGFSADEAARLSVEFTRLSADASSFFNLPFQDAFSKIRAGLSGESEPLKDLGILMNEEMVKAQAYAMGLAKVGQELSNQAKVQARAAIISRGLADAQGDLARTADGVANRTRELSGRVENLAGTIGNALQPAAQAALGELSAAVTALSLYWEDNSAAVLAWGETTVGSAAGATTAVGILQRSVGGIGDAWQLAREAGIAAMYGMAQASRALNQVWSYSVKIIGAFFPAFKQLADLADSYLADAVEKSKRLADDIYEELGKAATEPWKSEAIDEYFDRARAQIAAIRKQAAARPAAAALMGPVAGAAAAAGGAPSATATGKVEYASMIAAGSREAANAVLRSRYGSGQVEKGPEQQTAKNTAKTNDLLGQILASATGIPGLRAGAVFGNF